MGKLLRECVECFGMRRKHETEKKKKTLKLYHGTAEEFVFSSVFACIKGPLSTSKEKSVAVQFAANTGMILELGIFVDEWRYKVNEGPFAKERICCFETQWLSDFPHENEVLLIGGLNICRIDNIITAKGKDYVHYIKGIKQSTYNCFIEDGWGNECDIPSTKLEKKMVSALMSHELHTYCYPKKKDFEEFKGCPDYISNLFHRHCQGIKFVSFRNRKNENEYHEKLFKNDKDWLKLDVLTTLYPNMERLTFDARRLSLAFFKNEEIYESVLLWLKNRLKFTKLAKISIQTDSSIKQLQSFIDGYNTKFTEHEWTVQILCTAGYGEGMTKYQNDGYEEDHRIELIIAANAALKPQSSEVNKWKRLAELLLFFCCIGIAIYREICKYYAVADIYNVFAVICQMNFLLYIITGYIMGDYGRFCSGIVFYRGTVYLLDAANNDIGLNITIFLILYFQIMIIFHSFRGYVFECCINVAHEHLATCPGGRHQILNLSTDGKLIMVLWLIKSYLAGEWGYVSGSWNFVWYMNYFAVILAPLYVRKYKTTETNLGGTESVASYLSKRKPVYDFQPNAETLTKIRNINRWVGCAFLVLYFADLCRLELFIVWIIGFPYAYQNTLCIIHALGPRYMPRLYMPLMQYAYHHSDSS
eukprot:237012_1